MMDLQEKQGSKYKITVEEKDKSSPSILSRLKDPAYRSKLLRWMWLPCGLFTLGISSSMGGPTILDLRIITGVDEENGSFFFTTLFGGHLLGSFVSGAIHGKVNNNLVMAVLLILGGAVTIVTPYCSTFTQMLCVRVIAGCFLGGIDCTVNAEHMRIWGTEGQALLMFVHFSYAIGGVIGPTFSAPFLTEEEDKNKTATQPNVTQIPMLNHTETQTSTLPQTTEVHYAYLIAGIILSVASIPFLVMLIFFRKSKVQEETYAEGRQRNFPTPITVFLVTILCIFYVLYCSVEVTFRSFLETFLVDEFKDISKAVAAHITAYFWAAFAAGRFAAIFTSKFVVAVRLLYTQLCLLIIAIIGFAVSAHYHNIDAVTGFTCLIGLGCSSFYPLGISWTEEEILKVTGNIAGVILVGSSIGAMVTPYIMGYLMQNVTSFWFCYFLAGAFAVTAVLFVFMLLFNRLYVNRKYGKFDHTTEQEQETKSPPEKP